MYFLLQPGPSHLQNLTPKFKISNVFWTWSLSKKKTHQFDCFDWLSIFKDLVILSGSNNIRNVMQMALK